MNNLRTLPGVLFQFASWGAIGFLFASSCSATESKAPNIVFFVADDIGWRDLGCYGSPLHQTPNIDQLAAEGVLFDQAYAAGCSCSPTRASLMTGKYPACLQMTSITEKHLGTRAPVDSRLLPPPTRPYLPKEEVTIAELLGTVGYTTALVGKWHLGEGEFGPKGHGFDVAIAPPHKGMPKSYFWPAWKGNPNMLGRFEGEYLTDRLAEEACGFIKKNQVAPFFLALSFHSVHVPIEAKQEKVKKYTALLSRSETNDYQHRNAHYAAMVESIDDAVGRVLETLQNLKLEQNTLVLFISDNGGLIHTSHVGKHTPPTSNNPLRSGKGLLYEGGIRVPLIVKWPGEIEKNAKNTSLVISNDILPTFCEAAGVAPTDLPPSVDGLNLLSTLSIPDTDSIERSLYWHYPHFSSMGGRPSGAIRAGEWKLVEHFESKQIELFNLGLDIGETKDLSTVFPEKAQELQQSLVAWRNRHNAGMPERPNPAYGQPIPKSQK